METAKEQDSCEVSLNIETMEALGNFKENLIQKERERFSHIKLNQPFFIIINEWQKMTKNRSQNHFKGTTYIDILLEKLRDLYSGFGYCIDTNYLRKPSSVLNLRENDKRHYEGYAKIYCKHATCCGCEVMGSVRFYVHLSRVEAMPKISGKRIHIRPCVKSRPLKGKKRTEINKKLKFQRPFSIYRNLQANLTEDERACGSCTYAPSHAVLRNIKSQENISQRYTVVDNWIISTQMMDKQTIEKNGAFIRGIGAKPPRVVLFTDAHIKFFVDVCKAAFTRATFLRAIFLLKWIWQSCIYSTAVLIMIIGTLMMEVIVLSWFHTNTVKPRFNGQMRTNDSPLLEKVR